MDSNRRRDVVRVRVFRFDRESPGKYVDNIADDFLCPVSDLSSRLSEAVAELPANHFAIVCDALPYAAITLGHARTSGELGKGEPEDRENLDSTPQGLARN